MANLTLIISPEHISRLEAAFSSEFGYTKTIINADGAEVANPVSITEFAKKRMADYAKRIVKEYEMKKAEGAARKTILDAPEIEIQ